MRRVEGELPLETKGEKIAEILKELAQTAPDEPVIFEDIARKVTTTRQRVSQVYHQLIEAEEPVPPKLSPRGGSIETSEMRQRDQQIKVLWLRGLSRRAIAENLKIPETTLGGVINSNLRPKGEIGYRHLRGEAREKKAKEVEPLYHQGKTRAQVREETGLTRGQLDYLIKQKQESGGWPRQRRHRSPDKRGLLDLQVEGLLRINLRPSQMIERLRLFHPGLVVSDIYNSKQRLKRKGRIELC